MHQAGSRGKLGTWAERQMIGYSNTATELNAVAESHGARQADIACDHAATAYIGIVGNLDEIVDLGALADDGVGQGAAIDRGIGADLDVVLDDHPPDMRQPLGRAGSGHETKTLLADLGTAVDDHAIADQRALYGCRGSDIAVAADLRRCADDRIGGNDRPRPDRHVRPYHGTGFDDDPGLEAGLL